MKNIPTTNGMNIEIGAKYSFTNDFGNTYKVIVSRVTESSVFVYKMLRNYDGSEVGYSKTENREGAKSFSKFKKV